MTVQITKAGGVLLALCLVAAPVNGGVYSTIDAPEEVRFNLNYQGLPQERKPGFQHVLIQLQNIPNPAGKDYPIRQRCWLVETLGRKGALELKTLEQKLNYTTVLIRLNQADQAVQILLPLSREHPENFIVQAQTATAHFFAGEPLRSNAGDYMRNALQAWPTSWEDLKKDAAMFQFVQSLGWEEFDFLRNRHYETYLDRLIRNRLREERLAKLGKPVEDAIDPIFVDEKKQPVKFANEAGAFEVGGIAPAEFKKLPRGLIGPIDIVEQLLIWMPHDQRLFWLLGEVFNASAMTYKGDSAKVVEARNEAIRDAYRIFARMNDFQSPMKYGAKQTKERYDLLKAAVDKMPLPRGISEEEIKKFLPPDKDDKPAITSDQWWRGLTVSFITGFAVGLFALWQYQELRRRRQARSTSASASGR